MYTKQKGHLKNLANIKTRDYWQKFCASEDWFDPGVSYVIKNIINQHSSFRRKQWECATIFMNLYQYGMLDGSKTGAAFGAGRELLMFRIAEFAKKFYATDVYSMSTVWQTANIKNHSGPEEFVKAEAPEGTDTDNLTVLDMDMRDLSYFDDNSLDFCYSSCAFEHIGHRPDFIDHLKEVRRVLKPGGIYSMTTEFLFNAETKPIKGNYKFDIEYLRALFDEAGLDTEKEFDGHCDPNLINWPKPPIDSLTVKHLTNKIPTPFLYLEGLPYSTCNFVLSPAEGPVQTFAVSHLDRTANMMTNRVLANVKLTFKEWQQLDPFNRLRREVKNYLEDHKEYLMQDGFEVDLKENLVQGLLVYTDFLYMHDFPTMFKVSYNIVNYDDNIQWVLIEKNPMQVEGRKTIRKVISKRHHNSEVTIEFTPDKNKVYALSAEVKKKTSKLEIKSLMVWVKLASK